MRFIHRGRRTQLQAGRPVTAPLATPATSGAVPLPQPSHGSQVSPRTVVVITATLGVLALGLYLIVALQEIIRWLVISTFLATALHPAVGQAQRTRLPRALSVLVVYLGPRVSTPNHSAASRWIAEAALINRALVTPPIRP